MKTAFLLLLSLFTMQLGFAAAPSTPVRTIKNLPGFPMESLRRTIDHQLFRSLEVSPLEAWVVARSLIFGRKTQAPKIIHEEADGAYDDLIKAIAQTYEVSGGDSTESRAASDSMTYHLLIFDIKDGKMGVCVPHSDDARNLGVRQFNDTWIGIRKNGTWTTVSKPVSHRRF